MLEHLLLTLLDAAKPQPGKALGNCVKEVTCTHCGCRFVYHLQRSATGQASGFHLSKVTANQAAQENAVKNLQKRLDQECDPHPCPDCGHYQPDMVRVLKRRHRSVLMKTGLAVAVLSGACVLVYMARDAWRQPLPLWGLIAIQLGVMLMIVAWFMRIWYDPNADAESRARSPRTSDTGPYRLDEYRRLIGNTPNPTQSTAPNPPH